MKKEQTTISAFTFLRNGEMLGYPFIESIKSVLPLVDEFIVNIGPCEDNTVALVEAIDNKKIKIIHSVWNEKMHARGYVYGQQKMIAQFNCSGDWAFYVEADEVIHENDIENIREATIKYRDDNEVEAIAFNYLHFYGNMKTNLNSPSWYRSETRIIKNSIRTYAPDGLYWIVLKSKKIGRYPKAIKLDATIFHYGWVRSEEQTDLKLQKVSKYWKKTHEERTDYSQIDYKTLRKFTGTHPKIMQKHVSDETEVFIADPNYKLTKKDKRNRLLLKIESIFKNDFSKKHYSIVKR